MDDDIRVRLRTEGFDTGAKAIDQVGKSFKHLEDDSTSALTKLADELDQFTQAAREELEGAERAAAALGNALGPELAARTDMGGTIRQLRQLGVSFDEIEADADRFAASLRRLDDVETGFKKLSPAVRDTRGELDQSRNVMANFTGNAIQELPGVAGAFGPLNTAASQFVEYATEGGIALKGLIATAAPMAAVAIGVATVAGHFKNISESKAFNREKVDNFTDALRDGVEVAEALRSKIEETGVIDFRGGAMSAAKDMVPVLSALNLELGDWLALVQMGPEALDEWAKANWGTTRGELEGLTFGFIKATETQKQQLLVLQAAALEHDNINKAIARHRAEVDVLGASEAEMIRLAGEYRERAAGVLDIERARTTTTAQLASNVETLADAHRDNALQATAHELATERAAAAEEQLAGVINTVTNATLARASSQLRSASAELAAQKALEAYNKTLEAGDPEAIESANLALQQSYLAVAEAAGAAAVDGLGPAASAADQAAARNAAMRTSLTELARSLEPGSEAYQAVNEWIAALGRIPAQVTTVLGVKVSGARWTDDGDLIGSVKTRAVGGVAGGPTLVHKDEVVDLPPGTYVHPASGAPAPQIVDQSVTHIYYPPGITPEQVDSGSRRWRRRNGDT